MSTHKGRWYACCGMGKGWHRLIHKKSRQKAKQDIRLSREPRRDRARGGW